MPQGQIDFTQYSGNPAPAQINFSTYESGAKQDKGAATRFLERYTGLPVGDILDNPGKYVNVFGKKYWQAAKDNRNQSVVPDLSRGNPLIPGHQTMLDLRDRNYAGAVGDVLPAIQAVAPFTRGAASAARPAVASTLRVASDIVDPEITGAFSPRLAHMQRLAGKMATVLQKPPVKEPAPALPEPAESVYPEAQQVEPENAAPSLREQSQAQISQPKPGYPEGLQKRPTDRAEIVSDKAIQDAMRNNLEQHGWQALSQERKEFFANNGPQLGKADLIAQARAEAIRAEAEQRAQQVLAEAANPTVKLTKMPKAKVPAAAKAQPVAEDLNSPNRLVDLMQQSIDLINSRKGK